MVLIDSQDALVLFIHGSKALFGKARVQVALRVSLLQAFVLVDCLLSMVQPDLFKDELLELWNAETEKLEVKIELVDRFTCRLILFEMQPGHVGMLQSLLDCDP